LYAQVKQNLISSCPHLKDAQAVYREFRAGDVRHSLASIDKAREMLGYEPAQTMGQGVVLAMPWYKSQSQEVN
jgi:UDP-N-acetylglucosamine 4-epimerase